MHLLSRVINPSRRSPIIPRFLIVRHTSAGPPPAAPAQEGSLTYKYEKFIGKWPKVLALHRTVVDGSRWCFADVKLYFKTRRAISRGEKKLNDLSLAELETLVQSGGELAKVLALMVVIQIPGPGDILVLMLIFFPRIVLTRHFWSDAQRKEFFQLEINKALISGEQLLKEVGNPSISDESKMKGVTELESNSTLLMHGLHSMYFLPGSARRIEKRAEALRQIDALMPQVIDSLNERQLVFHCYIRKIDIEGKSENEMRESLRDYLKFTSKMSKTMYLYASAFFKNK